MATIWLQLCLGIYPLHSNLIKQKKLLVHGNNTISGGGGYKEGGDVRMWMSRTGNFYRNA
jgi:hypothetical protein